MTIEEIKEWRKSPTCRFRAYDVIDTLLAVVERLNDCKGCDLPRRVTIATEALERVATNPLVHSNNQQPEMSPDGIARTALERIGSNG